MGFAVYGIEQKSHDFDLKNRLTRLVVDRGEMSISRRTH